ncbi:aspartate 1-decarboxylase [Salinithrix halophila]|uniref:Aspartate 1-decarboxylase n=1 Tax=Salinithrix halophila TaxID=1485204 RepID=A0ABV8JGT7_9BACL
MIRWMCKGKIHRATVTESDLDYEGSICMDRELMKAAAIRPYEMVQVTSLRNAALWRTYAIPVPDPGKVALNGPPAHLFKPGDLVVILSMALVDESQLSGLRPRVVLVNEENQIVGLKEVDLQEKEWDA